MAKKSRRRRRRGEGSIVQRKDGSWVGYILTTQIHNGRRRRRYASGATYEEVRRALAKLQSSADAGSLTEASELTLSQYLDHWLKHSVEGSVRQGTYDNYENLVKNHIQAKIGSLRLGTVSEFTVEQMVKSIAESSSAGVAKRCLALLKRALGKVVPRILSSNPCLQISVPRVTQKPIHPLNREQAEKLIDDFSGSRLGALYVLAVLSGARMGELLALSWSDIDFEASALSIRRTLSNSGAKTKIDEPKTKSSRRRILLPKRAIEALHEHRKKMLVEGNAFAKTVFCTSAGGVMTRAALHGDFKRLLKASGLPDIRFHDLRHTHATLLFLAEENPKAVSERLGHSRVSITLDIYSHVLPSIQEQTKAKLDTMFG